jgi:hypothetical protein
MDLQRLPKPIPDYSRYDKTRVRVSVTKYKDVRLLPITFEHLQRGEGFRQNNLSADRQHNRRGHRPILVLGRTNPRTIVNSRDLDLHQSHPSGECIDILRDIRVRLQVGKRDVRPVVGERINVRQEPEAGVALIKSIRGDLSYERGLSSLMMP